MYPYAQHTCLALQSSEESTGSPGTEVIDYHVGAEN